MLTGCTTYYQAKQDHLIKTAKYLCKPVGGLWYITPGDTFNHDVATCMNGKDIEMSPKIFFRRK